MAGPAVKDVIIRLWPADPIPNSHFGLVQRLVEALPRIDAFKRSSCIEGARMAFARVKVQWAKMKAAGIATVGPPEGKEHRRPEKYLTRSSREPALWRGSVRRISSLSS